MVLNGCGEGYVVNPARFNVNVTAGRSEDQILTVVSGFLGSEGFEYLGKYQEMISLSEQGSMPAKVKQEELARLNRERTFLNRPRQFRIVLSDYSNGDYSELEIKYKPPFDHFVEISVYEDRPGGFSSDGFLFYHRLLPALKSNSAAMSWWLPSLRPPTMPSIGALPTSIPRRQFWDGSLLLSSPWP
jgi:hypothetical protein